MDGDLDQAVLSAQMALESAHGLADMLLTQDSGPLPTVPSGVPGMRFLSAGSEGARQRIAISPAMLDTELPRIQQAGGRLVIHGGPLFDTASTRLIAAKADATILMVRWASTPLSAIAEAAMVVREAGGVAAGVVLLDAVCKVSSAKLRRQSVWHQQDYPGWSGSQPLSADR